MERIRAQGAFVKILKPRADTPDRDRVDAANVVRDFEMTTRVRGALGKLCGTDRCSSDACFPEELAIVTGEAAGPTLSEVLARRAWVGRGLQTARELSSSCTAWERG